MGVVHIYRNHWHALHSYYNYLTSALRRKLVFGTWCSDWKNIGEKCKYIVYSTKSLLQSKTFFRMYVSLPSET